ncbi:YncE family protein [Novosphingobium sp. RD2P27]|uniref:YncE family protein n=1 Tax=Novosphingobium kalidii TaxID=3230299 RepID=A0ABV2D201_9SPHN
MRHLRAFVSSLAVGCAALPALALALEEQVIEVPGFADFLAVDGETVWATNAGRVERWSRTGKLAEVAMTRPCGAMTMLEQDLWVADCKEGALIRIDARSAKKSATIPTGIANPKGELNVAAGADSIWIASDDNGVISRVDPATNKVIAKIPVNPGTYYLTFGYGSLWAVSSKQQTVQRIDPKTNSVVKTIALGREPGFLAAGEGAVWVQEQGDGTVARIDPQTNDRVGRVKVGETLKYGDIDTGGGKVWLRTTEDQTFAVIDPNSMTVIARAGKPSGSGALRYTPAGVWTTAHDLHSMSWWSDPASIGE